MYLKRIGTVKIPRDRYCDLCGEEFPDMALETNDGIHVYHYECASKLNPPDATQKDDMIAEQLTFLI